MKRRTVLTGAALLPIGLVLAGCGSQANATATRIYLLNRSVPLRLIKAFQRQKPPETKVSFETGETLFELFQQLQAWQADPADSAPGFQLPLPQLPGRQAAPTQRADLTTLGDYWLRAAIANQLIQPLPVAQVPAWKTLDPLWQALVRRDRQGLTLADDPQERPDPGGEIWGLPYRWGYLQIVYNRRRFDALGWQPQTWADLLRPELHRQIVLPDHPRLVLGLALKSLGQSANTPDPRTVSGLTERLAALQQQTYFYSADHYLEPLVLEDVVLAVGWSTDILPLVQEYRQFATVAPLEGTLLSADLWVRPTAATAATTPLSAVTQAWLQYCLAPETALELTLYSQAASPLFWGRAPRDLPEALKGKPQLTLTPELQRKSDLIAALPESAEKIYNDLWQQMRSQTT